MEIQVTIPDAIVTSYLNFYNEVRGTKLKLSKLTPKQQAKIANAFADLASGEIEMRTDDHDEFATDTYFGKL